MQLPSYFSLKQRTGSYLQRAKKSGGLLFCMLLLSTLAPAAHAQNVLILSSMDRETVPTGAIDALTNLLAEFNAAGATITHITNHDLPGAVTAASFTAGAGGPFDLVVVTRLVQPLDPGNLSAINSAIASRAANGFVLLYDTGGNAASLAATDLRDELNAAGGFGMTVSGPVTTDISAPLNTNSPYSSSFTANPMRMGYLNYLNNVPPANSLYLAQGSALPPVGSVTNVNNVVGVFVPATQSFGGTGACLFGFPDISMFELRNYTGASNGIGGPNTTGITNQGKLASTWIGAVRMGGACGLPATISKAFLPTLVVPDGVSTLTITIENASPTAVSGLNVTDNLPAPAVVAGAASTTCTGATPTANVGASSISLAGATLPVGGCTITVPVRWPAAAAAQCAGAGTTITNTITPGTDFTTSQGQVNTPATATLTCQGDPIPPIASTPVSVPTLSQLALAVLALLLGWVAHAQLAAQRRR